jgi:hypothetical protein
VSISQDVFRFGALGVLSQNHSHMFPLNFCRNFRFSEQIVALPSSNNLLPARVQLPDSGYFLQIFQAKYTEHFLPKYLHFNGCSFY